MSTEDTTPDPKWYASSEDLPVLVGLLDDARLLLKAVSRTKLRQRFALGHEVVLLLPDALVRGATSIQGFPVIRYDYRAEGGPMAAIRRRPSPWASPPPPLPGDAGTVEPPF